MPAVPTAKGVNPIKMLAFERLMTLGAPPMEVRARLGLGASTYRRYLARWRRSQAHPDHRCAS